jgi:hypothetical protein
MSLASGTMEGIGSLLERYKRISVPVYQRNYSWDVEQVRELLNDIFGCMQSGSTHFLGCLILQDNDADKTQCEVVDGQQRLTSIMLILARIQDELELLKSQGKHEISGHGDELPRTPSQEVQKLIFDGNFSKPRFTSNPLISDMFREKILKPNRQEQPPERDTKQKAITLPLRKAFWLIRDRIQEETSRIQDDDARLRYLAKLQDAVKGLQILCITTNSSDESLDVFLTLNNRGLPLGPADIIRGQLVQALTEGLTIDQVNTVHTKVFSEWQKIMKAFDDAGEQQNSIDQFFRYYLLATGTNPVQGRKAPKEMDARIQYKDRDRTQPRNIEERREEAIRVWSEIQIYAQTWINLLQPPNDFSADCTYQLQILRNISDNYRVLLLNVFSPTLNVPELMRAEVARLSVVLTMRWYMNGQGAQDLESKFQQLGAHFLTSKDVDDLVLKLREMADIDPPLEARFKEGVRGFSKAILHGIDRCLSLKVGANPLSWNTSDLHVEHIAPESSTDEWLMTLYPGGDMAFEYEDAVQQIGNLTILDKKMNIRLQQSSFEIKKSKYAESTSRMARDLSGLPDWSLNEISSRLKWLVEMFDVIWSKNAPELSRVVHYSEWKSLPKAE